MATQPAPKTAEPKVNRVQLTPEGETFFLLSSDSSDLEKSPLIHESCKGSMDKLWISERVSMLACRRCGYQVSVPSSIKTHGDLKKWSENVVLFKK